MERFNIIHEWQGYHSAFSNMLLWVLEARKTCEDPAALAMLAEVLAFVRQEIEAVPDFS